MKIDRYLDYNYYIYIYTDIDLDEFKIKNIIKKLQKKLKLRGFYQVFVSLKKIGCFIELVKMEDAYYKDTLDLRVIFEDRDIYFKTSDYFLIKDLSTIRYFDGVYYGLVDDSFDELLEKVEFGDFVYGCEELLKHSLLV